MTALLDLADRLPALPAAVARLLAMLGDDETETAELVGTFAEDPALTGRLLKLANSAYYGVSRRVSTIPQALLVLGRKTTHSLVIAIAAEDVLRQPCEGYLQPAGGLWRHSLAVAHAARLLALRSRLADKDEAFVAGLLHDIGKVVVSEFLVDHADRITERLGSSDQVAFITVEQELLAVDYAIVGAAIAEHWQLPERLGDAIRYHPCPSQAKADPALPTVLHVANAIALALGIGLGLDGMMCELDGAAAERLKLDDAELLALAGELLAAMGEAGHE